MEETPVSILSHRGLNNPHLPAHLRRQDPDRVELMISCTDLADLDEFSKSDPMCAIFTKQFGQWTELGRSEAILESLNPKFTETFILDYDWETCTPMLFTVYDIDSRSTDLKKHDQVGSVEVDLSTLLNPERQITMTSLSLRFPGDPKSRGHIHITAELVRNSRSKLYMHLGAIKLDKKGFFNLSKTDTYVELSRSLGSDASFHPIHRTELVFKSCDPRWRPIEISVQKLCNGDLDRPIEMSCWHSPSNNQTVLIGAAVTSVRKLLQYKGKGYNTLPLIEPKKARKKKYKHSGELKMLRFHLDSAHTLLDFIRGGCSLKFTVAIDFTASNGDITDPLSLHRIDTNVDNQYINAITTLGGLLSHYDLSQDVAAYGFGAKVGKKRKQTLKECFPLTLNSENVFTKGIKGVIETYRSTVPKLKFAGPSRIAPVINEVLTTMSNESPVSQDNQFYHVLMVITDGVINDLDRTIDALIQSANHPISVVIVGIGPADFTSLNEIFLPNVALRSHTSKEVASRCNVHFVCLRKQKYTTGVNNTLARETLGIVSQQMVSYMKQNSLGPNRPVLVKTDPGLGGWVDCTGSTAKLGLSTSLSTTALNMLDPQVNAAGNAQIRRHKSVNEMGLSCPTCGAMLEQSRDVIIDNPRAKTTL